MNPREIEVHIDELILDGFDLSARRMGEIVSKELNELLSEKGLPAAWLSGQDHIDAGDVRCSNRSGLRGLGVGIAHSIYGGGRQ